MFNLVRFVALRTLAHKPLKTVLTVVGIAVGAALFVAIRAINDSTLAFFRGNVTAITGRAALTVRSGEAGFGEEKVEVVRAVPGVEAAVPTVETRARFEAKAGGRQTLVVLGIDFLQEASVRTYKASADVLADPLEFLNQADSIVVTESFAKENGLALDSRFDLATAHGKKTFVVRGLMSSDGAAAAYGGGVAVMDIDGARATFGKEGKVDRIDVVPEEGADERALRGRIEAALGPGFVVQPRENQSEALARMVNGYQNVLTFLSTLALLVGACLVANTVSLNVAERRREIAVLRALGASRARVLVLFVAEAVLLGVVGGMLGVVFGRALASLLVERVSASMSRQYVTPIDVSEIQFRFAHALLGVAAGTLASALAAVWPAWRASTIRGAEAFGVGEVSAATPVARRRGAFSFALGATLLLALFCGTALHVEAHVARVALVYPVLGGVGTAVLAPLLVAGGVRVLAATGLLTRLPVVRLAAETLLMNPTRTGKSALSLVVALMLVVVMGTVHRSFQRSIGDWQDRTFRTDVVVSSSGRVVSNEVQPLLESLAGEIDRVPGVDVAEGCGARGLRVARITYAGREIGLKALDRPHPRTGYSFLEPTSGTAEDAGRALYDARTPAVLVSEGFAAHFGKHAGDELVLETPAGLAQFHIAATVVEFSHPEGVVLIARDAYKRYWNDPLVTAFAVEAAPGTTPEALRRAIDAELGERGLVAMVNGELKKQLEEALDESLAYTRAIEAAALAVGLIGLLGTVALSLFERLRELGTLRAIGMSRAQLVRMVVAEAALVGGFGGVAAALLGAFVARAWVVGSLATSLGWPISVHVPWAAVLSTLSFGISVGVVAGLLSARRVAFVPIREALA